jgi:hypothetical protein
METKTISKNGASLKIQIGKENQLKRCMLATVLLLFSIGLTSAQQIEWVLKTAKGDYPFHNGIACFYENGKYGAIDINGKVVIEPLFKRSFEFKDGFAVIETDKGKGVINRSGIFILEPIYKDIEKQKEAEGLYVVKSTDGKTGIFYNNRLVLPTIYDYAFTDCFPIIRAKNYCINILNGKLYDRAELSQDKLIIEAQSGGNYSYFTRDGYEIDESSDLWVSSKGIILYKDEISGKYGLKEKKTEKIVSRPIYLSATLPLFLHDIMIMRYSNDNNFSQTMINASGKEVIQSNIFKYIWRVNEHVVQVQTFDDKWGLYSVTGKKLSPTIYDFINYKTSGYIVATKNLYKDNEEFCFFSANGEKMLTGYKSFSVENDGMIAVSKMINGKNQWGYINCETMQEITPQFDNALEFSGGLACVAKNGKDFFIDKTGKVMLAENDRIIFGSRVSEGLLFAKDKKTGESGYINPYVFIRTNSSEAASANRWLVAERESEKNSFENTINSWIEEGYKNFNLKKYAIAKEYYYKAMMSAPTNVNAIIGYGTCLQNMGYNEEALESFYMALGIEPNNQTALNNVKITRKDMQAQTQQQQQQPQKKSTFMDALATFGSVLYDVSSAYINIYYNNSGGGNSGGYSGGGGESSGGSSSGKVCSSCGGSGRHGLCGGKGYTVQDVGYYTGKTVMKEIKCNCSGGKCTTCHGKGTR